MMPVKCDIQALAIKYNKPIHPDLLKACAMANIPVPATTQLVV